MSETQVDVTVCQANTKRHWPRAAWRIRNMLRAAEERGATIITFNELSKEQALAVKALPGWDVYWEVNDRFANGDWTANAVAWKVSEFELLRGWASPTTINYRTGTPLRRNRSPWFKRRLNQACVRLRSKKLMNWRIVVQAFHYPTLFNSDLESRQRCANNSSSFAKIRIRNDIPVILGGDGNNIFPKTDQLSLAKREGPDAIFSSGKVIRSVVLHFKRKLWSDHNGILSTIRFPA